MEKNRLSVLRTAGRTWLTILMVSALLIGTSGSILWRQDSAQKQREGPENRQMLLQPLPQFCRQMQAVKYSFNNLKQFHNSPWYRP
jgi:hypothetical protein